MYKALIGLAMFVAVLTPGLSGAETQTTKIGDQAVVYVVTPPQRGSALSKEEILDLIDKSKPANLNLPILDPKSDQPR
jgi:hypothetical protein